MRKAIFTWAFSIISIAAFAQANLSFQVEEHDFGQIKEVDGAVEYKFIFENDGTEPLLISKVDASCGCTTPQWTKTPVAPGEQGYILALYNPKNRPGSFRKTLTISSNAQESQKRIYIKGIVIPEPKDPAKEFPNVMGSLHSRYKSFQMGKVTTEKPVMKSFPVYNNSEHNAMTIVKAKELPEHIKVSFIPAVIPPKSLGQMAIVYDAKAKKDFGFVNDKVIIETDDEQQPEKEFHVIATITEFFPALSEEDMALAPSLKADKNLHDFGRLTQGEVSKAVFKLSNTGKKPLNIRTVKTNCNCAEASLSSNDIAAGESVDLEIVFNSSGRRGNQYKSITIFSNDPKEPTKRMVIKAFVEEGSK